MLFNKEILKNQQGLISKTGDPLKFSKEDFRDIERNFRPGKVWIPYTHSTDPRDNTGFAEKVWYDEGANSIWALMNVMDEEAAKRINSKMVQDVSVSLKRDKKRGWTLKHIALTLDPALTTQKPFQAEMEEGEYQIELNNLASFVNADGAQEEIMTDKDIAEKVDEKEVEKKEEVDLEATKGLIAKFKEMFDVAGKNQELEGTNETLQAELEKRDARITELEDSMKESKEAIEAFMDDRRKTTWTAVFESYLGKRCVPAEKALLAERISDPDALKAELEARADIGLTTKKTDAAPDDQKDNLLSNLDEAQLAFVQERGWDKEDNEKYLKLYLAQLEEQKA